jgi:molybdate transport system substrate-binding protein
MTWRLAVLLLVPAWLLTACAASAGSADGPSRPVRVAAASDLQFALDDVARLVEDRHPEIDLAVTYGSSGAFVQQISNGAPFDLYLSADLGYAQQLVDDDLAATENLFTYAVGGLALWVPAGSPIDPSAGLSVLADPAVRKVAIANPEHAPYGRAAVAALRAAGVHDVVADKLVLGENVAQAAEFVQSGNADAGVVASSLVVADPLRDEGTWVEVPGELFPALEQGGVILRSARDADAARAVRDALLGEDGREVLERHGFRTPDA